MSPSVHRCIASVIVQVLRLDKAGGRAAYTQSFSLFGRRVLRAMEEGIDPTRPDALAAWVAFAEAFDSFCMGEMGRKNAHALMADADTRARTLVLLQSISAVPAQTAQFNLLLAANRIARYAKRSDAALLAEMKTFKSVSSIARARAGVAVGRRRCSWPWACFSPLPTPSPSLPRPPARAAAHRRHPLHRRQARLPPPGPEGAVRDAGQVPRGRAAAGRRRPRARRPRRGRRLDRARRRLPQPPRGR